MEQLGKEAELVDVGQRLRSPAGRAANIDARAGSQQRAVCKCIEHD